MQGPGELSRQVILAQQQWVQMNMVKEAWLQEIPKHIWGR